MTIDVVEDDTHQLKFRRILGISFFVGTTPEAVALARQGQLVVVPSAPVLVTLPSDRATRQALLNADFAITDSMLMVLLWRVLEGEWLPRCSGLAYLRSLLANQSFQECDRVLWVMPTQEAMRRNEGWLRQQGFSFHGEDQYVAPVYHAGDIDDPALLALARKNCPDHIIIGLGGGTQERLGLFLKRNLEHKPSIHCIGGAIGFLNGDQVQIPVWVDTLGLGWLMRCLWKPRRFVPRYWRATRLIVMMLRHRTQLPG